MPGSDLQLVPTFFWRRIFWFSLFLKIRDARLMRSFLGSFTIGATVRNFYWKTVHGDCSWDTHLHETLSWSTSFVRRSTWTGSQNSLTIFVDVGSQCRAGALLGKTFCASRSRKFVIFLKNTSSVSGTFKKDRIKKILESKVTTFFESKKSKNFKKSSGKSGIFSMENQWKSKIFDFQNFWDFRFSLIFHWKFFSFYSRKKWSNFVDDFFELGKKNPDNQCSF